MTASTRNVQRILFDFFEELEQEVISNWEKLEEVKDE